MSDDKIAEIRARHDAVNNVLRGSAQIHDDRGYLLAEVERLRAWNARLRAQIAEYFAEPATHPVERAE